MKKAYVLASLYICFSILSIAPVLSEEKKSHFIPAPNETMEERLKRHQSVSDELYIDKTIDESVAAQDDENFVQHTHLVGFGTVGIENHKKFINMFNTAFPDGHTTVNDVVEEGNKVVRRFTYTGTHTGVWKSPWFTIPPTNKKIIFHGITWMHLKDGKVFERWEEWNLFEALVQMGVLPEPPYTSRLVEVGEE